MGEKEDGKNASEPTMEEILASIRRIIADEKEPEEATEAKPPVEDVLELTQMVQEDGSVVDLATPEPPKEPESPPPEPAAVEAPPPPPPPPPPEPPVKEEKTEKEKIVSDKTAMSAAASLASLASTVQIERMAAGVPAMTPLGNGGRTLEDMVIELMKPMMREWLDTHLPAIVEKMVQKEIERIAHRVQD